MKYIKLFENWNFEEMEKKFGKEYADAMRKSYNRIKSNKKSLTINNITKEDIEQLIDEYGHSAQSTFDEKEDSETLINMILDIKKMENPITLYRVLELEKSSDLDVNNIGKHFVLYKWMVDDELINSASIDKNEFPMYVVSVKTKKENIDLKNTIKTNLEWNTENEITLKNDSDIEVINIQPYEEFDNTL